MSNPQQQQAMHSKLQRARSLPNEEAWERGTSLANEHSSDDDILSDSDAAAADGDGRDQFPAALKLPSFFTPGALLAVSAQDEAERQAKQQQTQNYEAVMRKFQVRKVALRSAVAFSSRPQSNGSLHRSMSIPLQLSSRMPGQHEAERAAAVDAPVVDARPGSGNAPNARTTERNNSSLSINVNGDGARRSKVREVHPHSFPDPPRSMRFTLYRFLVKKKRRMLRRVRRVRDNLKSVIYPTSMVQRVREGVLFSSFVMQLVCLPLLPVYFPSQPRLLLALQITAEWIYFVDCALGFNTAFFKKTTRELVTTRREIARSYVAGWFGLDILSSIPVNTVVFFASGGKGLLEVNPVAYVLVDNVARIPRFVSFLRTLQALRAAARALRAGHNFWTWALLYSRYSHLLRIARLVCIVLLVEHYMACLWQYLSPSTPPAALESPLELYVQNFYNVVLLVNGQSVTTESVAQTVYSIAAVFVGSFILAIVFGNVAMLVSNFNSSATSYQRNLEKVFGAMNKLQLPPELQERVRQYFTHLWQEYDAVDADLVQFARELTPTLALEVRLCKYMNLITGVPYWRACSPDFVSHVIRSLVVRVYLPDDFVLRRCEINQDLFMINRGTCELSRPPPELEADSVPLARTSSRRGLLGSRATADTRAHQYKPKHDPTFHFSAAGNDSAELLQPGEVFGEMGLLLNFEHQFNVRAVTHVEMCVLSRTAFQKLLLRFQLDRPVVLAALLEDAIRKRELPFSMEQVFGVSVRHDPPSSSSSSFDGSDADEDERPNAQLTPAQAADFLVRKINHEVRDATLLFGFQPVTSGSASERTPEEDRTSATESTSESGPPAAASVAPPEPSAPPAALPPGRLASAGSSSSLRSDLLRGDAPALLSSRGRQSGSALALGSEQLLQLQEQLQHLTQRIDGVDAAQADVLATLAGLHAAVARVTANVVATKAAESAAAAAARASHHKQQRIPEATELVDEPSARPAPPPSAGGFRLRASRAMTGLAPRQLPETGESAARLPASRRRASMAPRRNAIVGGGARKPELLADSLWTQYSTPK